MYERFYCLNEKPFNATPNPKFLYLGEHHKEALANLIYGVHERKGFIVLTGEVGAGKTTLIRTLLERLGDNVRTALIFNPNLTIDDLFLTILDEFGLERECKTKVDFLSTLNDFLIECLERNENVLLIFDEAQNLSPTLLEEIRLLLNLETSNEKLLQIILSGQPELNQKLELKELRQLKQRIGIRYHIPPLTKKETKDYIKSRLKIAGAKDFSIFSDKAIDQIYGYAKGTPRLTNIICDNALLAGYAMNQGNIGPGIIKECINDLKSENTKNDIKTEISRNVPRKRFTTAVWRLVVIFFFLSLVMTGNPSHDSRHTSFYPEGRNKAIPALKADQDISERVRKEISSPEETGLRLKE